MTRLAFALLVIVQISCPSRAQEPPDHPNNAICSFSEAYRVDGWAVPGLNGARPRGDRQRVSNLQGVFMTALQPSDLQTTFEHVWCPYDHPGRLVVENEPIKVLDLWSFDFEGHIFAYRMSYAKEVADHGERSELGASSAVFFYDIDGSGHFAVVTGTTGGRGTLVPDRVPNWVNSNVTRVPTK